MSALEKSRISLPALIATFAEGTIMETLILKGFSSM
jgi:hypothetical protein